MARSRSSPGVRMVTAIGRRRLGPAGPARISSGSSAASVSGRRTEPVSLSRSIRMTLRRSVVLPMDPSCPGSGPAHGRADRYRYPVTEFAAVVLAGGRGRRLGGPDKPGRAVAGRPMVRRVLDAVSDATPRVVVGPATADLPPDVVLTREHPPGAGPVAAAAAGMALLGPATASVALLAADLPLLTPGAIRALRRGLASGSADGACYADESGRLQVLCGVWRAVALRRALARLSAERGATLTGASVQALVAGLAVAPVRWAGQGLPPWFDCDTDEDLRRAEEWAHEQT
jgi:molybdenum cofactor guanylyltransferase